MCPHRSGRVTPSRSREKGTLGQKSLDAPYTAGRRTRWSLSMDRLFLRESQSKKRCKAIDAVAKPTCSHRTIPDPIRARAPRRLLTARAQNEMPTNAVASFARRLAPRVRSNRTELVSSSTTNTPRAFFTTRAFCHGRFFLPHPLSKTKAYGRDKVPHP